MNFMDKQHIIIRRIFGRTADQDKISKFSNWFYKNIDKMEDTIDEKKPFNGILNLDYQAKTDSYIIEIQTSKLKFADQVKQKFAELGFDHSAIIGSVKEI